MSLAKKIEEKRKAKVKVRKIENAKNIGVGVVAGTLVGAVGGVLLAPKSGKETREGIKEASVNVGNKIGTKVKETYRVLGDKVLVKREQLSTEE